MKIKDQTKGTGEGVSMFLLLFSAIKQGYPFGGILRLFLEKSNITNNLIFELFLKIIHQKNKYYICLMKLKI